MSKPVVIDLLRHGEVEGPLSVARGCGTDVPLTGTGWQQMRRVADALHAQGSLTQVACSPMQRCAAFAERFSGEAGVPLMLLPSMREIDFGHWEGKEAHEIAEQELLARFMENPDGLTIPGGDRFDDFAERIIAGWQAWLAGADGEHRLLIAHGVVIRILIAHLLGQPRSHIWRLSLPYAAWSRVSLLDGEQPRLIFLNRETAA